MVPRQFRDCNLCGSDKKVILFHGRSPDPQFKSEFNLVQCKECGLMYVGEDRSPKEERALFGRDFFHGPYGYKDYCGQAKARLRVARQRLGKIEPLSHVGTILDVGCAMGFFLRAAEERGWIAYGVDVSRYACDYARCVMGLKVREVELKDAKFPEEFFDVITMLDVIAHMRDPLANLIEAFKILKKGGLLVVETRDVESFRARLSKGDWSWFHPPGDLFYFSMKTLRHMLKKVGFEPFRTNIRGKVLGGTFVEKLTGERFTRYLDFMLNMLNLGDVIIMYARKC